MKKGEIWLVDLPPTNGYEQSGLRPVLVLSRVEVNVVIILPFTANVSALRFPHTIEIQPSSSNGLNATSIVLVFQIRAIDRKRLQRKIGELAPEIVTSIDQMLRQILSL